MFHNDAPQQNVNNWKRIANEHPINRILTTYFNADKQTKRAQSNIRSNNQKSETNHIIQRQKVIRSFLNKPDESESLIRKSVSPYGRSRASLTASISSPRLLFADLNEQSTATTTTNHHRNHPKTIKKEHERHSPIVTRRQRSIIENLSIQERSDISNRYGNYLPPPTPPNYYSPQHDLSHSFLLDRSSLKVNSRIPTPHMKPLQYSKTISEDILKQNSLNMKGLHQTSFLPMNHWTPILPDQGTIQNRTSNGFSFSKSYLSKYSIKRHFHVLTSEKLNSISRKNNAETLRISPRLSPNLHNDSESSKKQHWKKIMTDEYDDSKWPHSVHSDDDESISIDGNSSTSTATSQISLPQHDSVPSSIVLGDEHDLTYSSKVPVDNSNCLVQRSSSKRSLSRRLTYNIALPPVAENVYDDETSDTTQ